MTVTELKEMLEKLEEEGHGEDVVRIWNEDTEYLLLVSRCEPLRGEDSVVLYSDSDDEEEEEDDQ